MQIETLDHLVLTVTDLQKTIIFYQQVLGMRSVKFNGSRYALQFGEHKINLHRLTDDIQPRAQQPTPGSADLCFITETPINEVIIHLNDQQVPIVEGPIQRTGATGKLLSVYIRGSDQNLIEIANRLQPCQKR